MEQAKCHQIPDFRQNRPERFLSIAPTGDEDTAGHPRARTSASGHSDRASTQFRILAFTREWDYPRPHSRSRGPPKEPDMSLSVMSADSHMDLIYLPPDTFTARMPSTW